MSNHRTVGTSKVHVLSTEYVLFGGFSSGHFWSLFFGDVLKLSVKFRNLTDNGGSSTQVVPGLSQDSD